MISTGTDRSGRVDRVVEQLQDHGMRNTAPRRAVVTAALQRTSRFTARDMLDELQESGVGRATVFRTINLLAELGVLNRIHAEDGCHAYTVCMPQHHHHLVCRSCGAVEDVISDTVEQALRTLATQSDFSLEEHHLELFGVCRDCSRGQPLEPSARGS
jgi:Fur family transcriptional regulator, ferric uptake regulator